MWYDAPWNSAIIKWVQTLSSPFFDFFFVTVTMMGEETFFMLVAALVFWCVNKKLGYRLVFTYLTGAFLAASLKDLFKVPRPIGEEGITSQRLETAEGYSFPSGHSFNATATWLTLSTHFKKHWFSILAWLSIALVALSRLYLGVHRPVDVLGGIILGWAWVWFFGWIFERIEKSGKRWILTIVIVPTLLTLFFMENSYAFKAAGVLVAFFVGYLVEPDWIDFKAKAPFAIQIAKLAIGLGGLFALRIFLKPLLSAFLWGDFLRYLLMGFWITIGSTWLFQRWWGEKSSA
ncbi:MAG TPA: phosphatase PAP2 family protein [Thermotogota bacterium]|nr:phosphatase PAP2 family protein [Thermotogota bacterium]